MTDHQVYELKTKFTPTLHSLFSALASQPVDIHLDLEIYKQTWLTYSDFTEKSECRRVHRTSREKGDRFISTLSTLLAVALNQALDLTNA